MISFHSIQIAIGVFLLRLIDVPISTVRSIFTIRGYRMVSFVLGLIESAVWVFAISRVMTTVKEEPMGMVGWALGFSTGTVMGITIEKWIGSGIVLVRVISRHHAVRLKEHLHSEGYGVTSVMGRGRDNEVMIMFVVAPRRRETDVLRSVNDVDPEAFITIEPVSRAVGGFPVGVPLPMATGTMKR